MTKTISTLFLFLMISLNVFPASFLKSKKDTIIETFNKNFVYHTLKAQAPIKIDGIIDEPDWQAAQKATDFFLVLPIDTGKAVQPSEVMLTYDDKALYVAIVFYDTVPGKRIAESFRRDFIFGNNDNFLAFFDTFLDQTNGFSFGVSASGAMWDGLMHDGAGSNLDWDCKMESKIKHYPDRWTAELRIPFKSLRYPAGSQRWNANFSRLDLKTNEKSSWAPVPRQFPTASLAYAGVLKFDEPLPRPRLNLSVIPYLFGSYSKNFEETADAGYRKDFGFDAKVGLSSSLNLDLTYNPDFAQVEVDQQQMNVDRFELFYPEKRQFFLENSDLFSGFGYNTVTPFFSRRIGLDAPVLGGARLSGKIGNDWRVGFMNMTTEKTVEHLSRNFSVLSVQKKVFARSNFGLILVNKEYLNQPADSGQFNRVAGFDYNLASKNNFWNGKLFYHRSFQPGNPDKQYAQGAMLSYNRKNIQIELSQTSVGENYLAEAGFVRRNGYNFLGPEIAWIFVPNKRVIAHGPFLESENFYDSGYHKIDHENTLGYQVQFRNNARIHAGVQDFFVKLLKDFDPSHASQQVLPAGSEYRWQHLFMQFYSDNRKNLTWEAKAMKGGFYSGHGNYLEGRVSYRYQPYANLSVNFTYTDIALPAPFERQQFWLVGPKLDLTFTDKIFLSTFVQYNEQVDNMNLNMRFQWRYQPVSDLFVVYTDNYLPGAWTPRNRALVLKLTYWLN